MFCDNCGKQSHRGELVYCCARAEYLPLACSDECKKALGGVNPDEVPDCGNHCNCGECLSCETAAFDKYMREKKDKKPCGCADKPMPQGC